MTTFDKVKVEDFRYIEVVEAMDIIEDDIRRTFKNDFIGKYKNNLDTQMIFLSAVNGYFRSLAKDEILDDTYQNVSFIDIEAQRQAWLTAW